METNAIIAHFLQQQHLLLQKLVEQQPQPTLFVPPPLPLLPVPPPLPVEPMAPPAPPMRPPVAFPRIPRKQPCFTLEETGECHDRNCNRCHSLCRRYARFGACQFGKRCHYVHICRR